MSCYSLLCQDMARYLILVEGASVNAQDNAGWTPLHEACCTSHAQLVDLLLRSGADVNISATDGTRLVQTLQLTLNGRTVANLRAKGLEKCLDVAVKL